MRARRGRQGAEKPPSVSLGQDARIKDGQHTPIQPAANQPAETLEEREGRQGDLVVTKGVATLGFDAASAPRPTDRTGTRRAAGR